MHTLDLRSLEAGDEWVVDIVPRAAVDVSAAVPTATHLIDDVRLRGETALIEQAERLDGVRPARIPVTAEDLARALVGLDTGVRDGLELAIDRVRAASIAQVPPSATTQFGAGARVLQRWQPVSRVGLYIPGGKAVYPSSVVMNVVPAQVAGVSSIAIASPAQSQFAGSVHPTILGAAALLGVEEVYAMGGAGAIGAFAYGVPSISLRPVDVITGPGNVYVAAAKRVVRGVVGIDSEAGPTEILVIADAFADARLVAHDLVSQAEHDELAAAVLVTDSPELAEAVAVEVKRIAEAAVHADRLRASLNGRQSAIVLVRDLAAAAAFSNAYGPEHLEVQTSHPHEMLPLLQNAGVIFLGSSSPVSLGDYVAGSNHVLPTGGQSRFSSGLGSYTFLRPQQVVSYDRHALRDVVEHIVALSSAEHLPAHGDAVSARFTDTDLPARIPSSL